MQAHIGPIACLALNPEGSRLATASDKGTLIRIFDTKDGKQVQELRRGAAQAEIFSIAFDAQTTHLAVSSSKGTVHFYGLKPEKEVVGAETLNVSSSLAFFQSILPSYFGSEWSPATYQLDAVCRSKGPESASHLGKSYVAFSKHDSNKCFIACDNGQMIQVYFNTTTGQCVPKSYGGDF